MPRGRVACWKASTAPETAREIAKTLEPHVARIAQLSDKVYTSASFNVRDTNTELLDKAAELLKDLQLLDPRGSHFSQEDMTESLHIGITAKSLGGTFKVHAEARGITNTEMEALIAMKVRVMCSHDRSRNAPEVKLEKDESRKGVFADVKKNSQ